MVASKSFALIVLSVFLSVNASPARTRVRRQDGEKTCTPILPDVSVTVFQEGSTTGLAGGGEPFPFIFTPATTTNGTTAFKIRAKSNNLLLFIDTEKCDASILLASSEAPQIDDAQRFYVKCREVDGSTVKGCHIISAKTGECLRFAKPGVQSPPYFAVCKSDSPFQNLHLLTDSKGEILCSERA